MKEFTFNEYIANYQPKTKQRLRANKKRIDKYAYGDFTPYEPFEVTIKRWASISAQQLRDAYKTQKVFNGTNDKNYEVWGPRIRKIIRKYKTKAGEVKKEVEIREHGWLEENEKRRKNHGSTGWYSTGMSWKTVQGESVTVPNSTWEHGQIDFKTTLQMLYAEAGVGANGKWKSRPRNIPVDRRQKYSHKNRYVRWIAGEGYTHRPNTRQQVSLFQRRLKWLAKKHFLFDLTTWLTYSIEDTFMTMETKGWTPLGYIVFKPSRTAQEEHLKAWDEAYK